MCIGFLFLGPAPYFPSGPSYPLTVCGLAFIGIGTAASLVSSFAGAQKAALRDAVLPPADVYPAISGKRNIE